jgi:hypothetical protein
VNQIRKEIEITRSIVPESPGDGDQGWKDKGKRKLEEFYGFLLIFCVEI